MDPEEARTFVAAQHRGVLATTRADGRPQLSPVLAVTDGEGRIVVSSRETAYKTRNLLQRPWAALCVFSDSWQGPWVQVEGPVEVLHLPEAMEPLVDYYRRAAGETEWSEYRDRMVSQQRVLLRLDVERAGPNVSG
jgi:PPOX class probable F420-dependent enzyme